MIPKRRQLRLSSSGHGTAGSSPASTARQRSNCATTKPDLHVGGLVNKEHVRWTEPSHTLKVGDVVTFRIVESDTADEPIAKSSGHTPEERSSKRYQTYKALKREFEGEESVSHSEEMDAQEAKRIRTRLYLEYREEFEPDR